MDYLIYMGIGGALVMAILAIFYKPKDSVLDPRFREINSELLELSSCKASASQLANHQEQIDLLTGSIKNLVGTNQQLIARINSLEAARVSSPKTVNIYHHQAPLARKGRGKSALIGGGH